MNKDKEELLVVLLSLDCFKKGKFKLKSGKLSNFYIDMRHIISYPKVLKKISNLLYLHINDKSKICGLPYAGIPYAQSISILYNIPNILLRKEKKDYGTSKMIEGIYKKGEEIIIIDDILTTGKSIIESLEYLKEFNIKKIIVIVDRNEGGKEKLEELGYVVESLYTIKDFENSYQD